MSMIGIPSRMLLEGSHNCYRFCRPFENVFDLETLSTHSGLVCRVRVALLMRSTELPPHFCHQTLSLCVSTFPFHTRSRSPRSHSSECIRRRRLLEF
jgi:hypothetical protein